MKHLTPPRLALILVLIATSLTLLTRTSDTPAPSQPAFSALSSEEQTTLLAAAVSAICEKSDGYTARLLIADVILNRLDSRLWGDTLWAAAEIDAGGGHLPLRADTASKSAAADALAGYRPLRGATAFGREGEEEEGVEILLRFGGYWFGK